jgi:Skp family chaperone for outer membrane proteins
MSSLVDNSASHRGAPTRYRGAVLPSLVLTLGLLAGVAAAGAQEAAARTPPRIAVVDLERVFLESPQGQKLRDELKQLEEATRTELEKRAKVMDDLTRTMEGKPVEEQRAIARRREDEELALRRVRDDAQRQAAKLESDRRREIESQLQPVFEKLQQEQDFDLILNKAPGFVIFSKDSIEITGQVLERIGAAGGGGSGA